MDGNFGLVRKTNSGTSSQPPLYSDVYFVDTEEANAFVTSYTNDNAGDKVSELQIRIPYILEYKQIQII